MIIKFESVSSFPFHHFDMFKIVLNANLTRPVLWLNGYKQCDAIHARQFVSFVFCSSPQCICLLMILIIYSDAKLGYANECLPGFYQTFR